MESSAQRQFPSSPRYAVALCITALAPFGLRADESEEFSIFRTPEEKSPKLALISDSEGTALYSGKELAQIFEELEVNRAKATTQQDTQVSEDELDLFILKPIEITPLDYDLFRKLDFELTGGENVASGKESKRERKERKLRTYAKRADERFWSGEYDGGRTSDVPPVGSIDLGKALEGLSKLFGKNKDKRDEKEKPTNEEN